MPTFNTTDPKPGYVYEVATDTWFPIAGIAPGSSVDRWRKTAAGSETSVSGLDDLSVTLSYEVGTEQVYLNGVLLVRTSDYTATNGTSITGLSALAANDVVEVISFNPVNIEKTDAILSTAINAKGDLIAGSADNTPSILTVGTNSYVLAASSAAATGLVWTDSAASTQTLTNKTIVAANNTLTGVVNNTLTTTTGDIIYASGANTPARLGIGSSAQVLTVASGVPSWATPSASSQNWTLVNAGGTTLVGSNSVTISGITGADKLMVNVLQASPVSAGALKCSLRINNDSTANTYNHMGLAIDVQSSYGTDVFEMFSNSNGSDNDNIRLCVFSSSASSQMTSTIFINGGNSSGAKPFQFQTGVKSSGSAGAKLVTSGGWYSGASTISSIVIVLESGNFDSGTIYVWKSA